MPDDPFDELEFRGGPCDGKFLRVPTESTEVIFHMAEPLTDNEFSEMVDLIAGRRSPAPIRKNAFKTVIYRRRYYANTLQSIMELV